MPRIIDSIEIIHPYPEPADRYMVGGSYKQRVIDYIEEHTSPSGAKTYLIFDGQRNLLLMIENAPVVVSYKEGEGV